jgi:predicted nucleic-acid-binding protein
MIGLDTNVLIRYIMQDDEKQGLQAGQIIDMAISQKSMLMVTLVVLCEIVWVLSYHYKLTRQEIITFIKHLLHAEQIEVENRQLALSALEVYQSSKADFSDCLIGLTNQFQGCTTTYTFDKKAAQINLFTLIQS